MFLIVGVVFLTLLSITLTMLWAHEKIVAKKVVPIARVQEYWNGDDRRLHARFDKELEVEYSVEKRPHLKNGSTVNLSNGGAKLLLDEKLPVGAIMDMKLHIPERRQTVEVEAEVVWTKDVERKDPAGKRYFHSGLKFIALKEPSGTNLSQYLIHLESKGSK